MLKRKKKRKNPGNPTPKENLLSAIRTGSADIGRLGTGSDTYENLQNLTMDELKEILGLIDTLSWELTKVKNSSFRHFGQKAGLK